MNSNYKIPHVLILLIISSTLAFSQPTSDLRDGIYTKENSYSRKRVGYTPIRELDVMWSKRIWRTLDLREKMNHPLYFPTEPNGSRKSLSQVVLQGVKEGSTDLTGFTAYSSLNDEFKIPLSKSEIDNMLVKYDTSYYVNDVGETVAVPTTTPLAPEYIKRYRLKEDWFFDKQRSVMDVRIIGICPVMESWVDGEYRGEMPLFWIYFDEARHIFSNQEVFNRYSDSERRTLEDIFWKR